MRLDEAYNDPHQLLGVGGLWSAGLPFWPRKVLANGGQPNDNACTEVSETIQLRVCRLAFYKSLAASKCGVSAGLPRGGSWAAASLADTISATHTAARIRLGAPVIAIS